VDGWKQIACLLIPVQYFCGGAEIQPFELRGGGARRLLLAEKNTLFGKDHARSKILAIHFASVTRCRQFLEWARSLLSRKIKSTARVTTVEDNQSEGQQEEKSPDEQPQASSKQETPLPHNSINQDIYLSSQRSNRLLERCVGTCRWPLPLLHSPRSVHAVHQRLRVAPAPCL